MGETLWLTRKVCPGRRTSPLRVIGLELILSAFSSTGLPSFRNVEALMPGHQFKDPCSESRLSCFIVTLRMLHEPHRHYNSGKTQERG